MLPVLEPRLDSPAVQVRLSRSADAAAGVVLMGTVYVCGGCGKRFPADKGTATVYKHVDACEGK